MAPDRHKNAPNRLGIVPGKRFDALFPFASYGCGHCLLKSFGPALFHFLLPLLLALLRVLQPIDGLFTIHSCFHNRIVFVFLAACLRLSEGHDACIDGRV